MVLFLTKLLLGDKTHLSKVWLAAHWEKKLSRYHIYQIDVESTVQDIMSPEIILDLRLSGHLLVGIVKIFSRKTIYLLNECNNIFTRVRGFRPGLTDLPEHKLQMPVNLITLPESFENFDYLQSKKMEELLSSHQSHVDDITLKETFSNTCLFKDYDFDENNLDEDIHHADFDDNNDLVSLLTENEQIPLIGIPVDDFKTPYPQYVESMDPGVNDVEYLNDVHDNDLVLLKETVENANNKSKMMNCNRHVSVNMDIISIGEKIMNSKKRAKSELLLEPLPGSFKFPNLARKKRKLIIDEVKKLDKEKIDRQLKDFRDITLPLDLAPPSKRLMELKKIGGADDLLHLPGLKIRNDKILKLYKQNLKLQKTEENLDASSGEESAYGSLDKHQLSSRELFPDEIIDMNNLLKSINCLPQNNSKANSLSCSSSMIGIDSDIEMSPINANAESQFIEKLSRSISFTNEFQHEISINDSTRNTLCILQDKISEMFKDVAINLKDDSDTLKFSTLVQNDRRIKVARKFLFLLILRKFEVLDLQQESTHAEIIISRGVNFIPAYLELCKK